MIIDQAVETAAIFLDDYIASQLGFSRTGDPGDFRLEFEDVYKSGDDTLVVVFGLQPGDDTDAPDPETLALAQRCCDAMVDAFPDILRFTIEYEFVN